MALILSGDTGVPASGMPAGSVIQTVQASYSTSVSTSSSSYVTTNLTASITPTSATSKILITYTLGDVSTSSPNSGVSVAVFKNGSQLTPQTNSRLCYIDTSATEAFAINSGPSHYYDSPATTSSTTYAVYFNNGGGGTATVFRDNTYGSILLQEIKV